MSYSKLNVFISQDSSELSIYMNRPGLKTLSGSVSNLLNSSWYQGLVSHNNSYKIIFLLCAFFEL
jgi:hypothetical protein